MEALFGHIVTIRPFWIVVEVNDWLPITFDAIFELDEKPCGYPTLSVEDEAQLCVWIVDPVGVRAVMHTMSLPDHRQAVGSWIILEIETVVGIGLVESNRVVNDRDRARACGEHFRQSVSER
jgi:hypothetical protein